MISQRRFSDYHLFRLLKESRLGKTYRAGRAQARAIDRVVLLHLFDRDPTSSGELWERIHRRGPIQEILDDPLFGRGVELGISSGIPFAAYDYQVGRPLDDILTRARERRMPLSIDQALAIVDQVATALVEAQKLHFEGSPILHGALTPELIQVSHRGAVKTFGFDTAPGLRILDPDSMYRSPEIRSGAVAAAADDVFALAAILFEALTGSPPVRNIPFEAQVDQALPFGEVSPLAPDLQDLLKHGLAKKDTRTPDVVRWRHELRTVIAGDAGCASAFQLSFFLHALFRQELESEGHEMQEEKAARWSVAVESEADETAAPTEALVVPTEQDRLDNEPESREEEEEAEREEEEAPAPGMAPAGEPRDRAPAYFLVGLAASLAVATVATTAFFWIGRTRSDGSASAVTAPAAKADAQIARELVASRAALLEEGLRAEYEPRLARLREQLVTARRRTASRPPIPKPQPVLVESDLENDPSSAGEPSSGPAPSDTGSELAASLDRGVEELAPPADQDNTAGSEAGAGVAALLTPVAELLGSGVEPEPSPMLLLDTVADERASTDPPANDPQARDTPAFTPPRVLQEPRPRYPRVAQRLGRSATVRLRVLVDERGKPIDTELLSDPIGLGFEQEAKRAVMASRWAAATRDGTEVTDWVVLKVEFSP